MTKVMFVPFTIIKRPANRIGFKEKRMIMELQTLC